MKSSVFTNGERYVIQGAAACNELSINDQVIVDKLKKGVTVEAWKKASPKERLEMVEPIVLAGSSLGFRQVVLNSLCTVWSKDNVPKSYTSLSEHQQFEVNVVTVKNFFFVK